MDLGEAGGGRVRRGGDFEGEITIYERYNISLTCFNKGGVSFCTTSDTISSLTPK